MSYLQLKDMNDGMMIVSLDRVYKVYISHELGCNIVELEPVTKDDPREMVSTSTPVEEIWEQIRMKT